MIESRLLTKDEFLRCFAAPMQKVTDTSEAAADIWPYVDGIDPKNMGGAQVGDVAHVYRDAKLRYDQVLLKTETANVFLVVVVDLAAKAVIGHHLLDLNIEYDLGTAR